MVSEIFPRITKFAAFPTSGGFSNNRAKAPLLRLFPKTESTPPPILARTLHNVKSQIDFLSRPLANSNNVIKPVSAAPEWYDNYQLLQSVHQFVEPVAAIQPSDVDHRQFAIPLTASISSQISMHHVYRLTTLRFALQLHALSSNTNPVFKCIVWAV